MNGVIFQIRGFFIYVSRSIVSKPNAYVNRSSENGLSSCTQAEFVWHKLSADNMDPDFVERRRVGLENFLLRVASHPVLSNDKILYYFLTEVHGAAVWANSANLLYMNS